MPENWENLVIETGVDTLLGYLAENGKASVSEISEEIGVKQDRIKEWADALEEEGLIGKNYTVTSGLVLLYNEEHVKEAKKKRDKVHEDLRRKSSKIMEHAEKKSKEIDEIKDQLEKTAMDMEAQELKDDSVDERLEEIEELEDQLNEHMDDFEDDEIKAEALNLMREIDKVIADIKGSEEDLDYDREEQEIRRKVKAFKKLHDKIEEHEREKISIEEEEKDEEDDEEEISESRLDSLKEKIPFRLPPNPLSTDEKENEDKGEESQDQASEEAQSEDFGGSVDVDYEGLLDNIEGAAEIKISELDNPDYEKLLELEKKGKDRKTLKNFIREEMEDG